MDVNSGNGEKFNFFSILANPVVTPWPILTVLHQNVEVCALHIEPHLATPPPPGADGPRGGGGTSADIVPTQIKFGVDPSTRC